MGNAVYPKYKAWKANGTSPASAYLLYTYESGGTTIPKTTYSDAGLLNENSNPIVLNAVGEANIFLDAGDYRFDLKSPAGALINTFDPVSSSGGGSAQSIAVVNNIVELRDFSRATAQAVLVLGYYEPDDLGGGIFHYQNDSESSDNGGTIILPNSAPLAGRWIRHYTGPLSLRWFGWVGDGSGTDNTAQDTFDAFCANLADGGEYVIPGYMKINSSDASPGGIILNNIDRTTAPEIDFQWAGESVGRIRSENDTGSILIEADSGGIDFNVEGDTQFAISVSAVYVKNLIGVGTRIVGVDQYGIIHAYTTFDGNYTITGTFHITDILTASSRVNIGGAADANTYMLNIAGGHVAINNNNWYFAYGLGNPGDANTEYLSMTHLGSGNGYLHLGKTGSGTNNTFSITIDNTEKFVLYKNGDVLCFAGFSYARHNLSANTTLSSVHKQIFASGAITITLPSAALNEGREYLIKNIGSNNVTIARSGSNLIDGTTSATLIYAASSAEGYTGCIACSDGTNWYLSKMGYQPGA